MDFGDSADEAAFRAQLRKWLHDNNPGLPASSTSDDYWAGQAAWHQALYDAGFSHQMELLEAASFVTADSLDEAAAKAVAAAKGAAA